LTKPEKYDIIYLSRRGGEPFTAVAKPCRDRQEENVRKLFWTTKGGKRILIEDMTDKHLMNTINMLYKLAPAVRQELIKQAREVTNHIRGTSRGRPRKIHMLEHAPDHYILMNGNDHYPSLIYEAERRGLI